MINSACPFSEQAFKLLATLHADPKASVYKEQRESFQKYLIEPFKDLMLNVAQRLPASISDRMETQKNLFSNIKKNDFRHGGAWDFYWGAFYLKGEKRTESTQLFLWINHERIDFGFFIGVYGKVQRDRLLSNCRKNSNAVSSLLYESLTGTDIHFSTRTKVKDASIGNYQIESKEDILKALDALRPYDLHIAMILTKEQIFNLSKEQIINLIIETYKKVFPFVLLTIEDDPLPKIDEYLSNYNPELRKLISVSSDSEAIQNSVIKPVKKIGLNEYSQSSLIDEFSLTPLGQSASISAMAHPQLSPIHNPVYPLTQCSSDLNIDEPILLEYLRALDRKKQAILYGPPGTGKTYMAKKLVNHLLSEGYGFSEVVQFHPAYTYEDFVQGIRPQKVNGTLDYPIVPGRFLSFCQKAKTLPPDQICVFIIDEINRANLAQVFGELMYLLEYRDEFVSLATGEKFSIPANVRIIGTMNTADRSIALVDHALRRRFAFLHVAPNYNLLRQYHQTTQYPIEGLIQQLKILNQSIDDHHYEIGPSFFLRSDLAEHLESIWRTEIEPYLEEYFFDQPKKVDQFRWHKVAEKIDELSQ
jgi:5-methylcytosine-specific restriction enzyme B